MNEIGKGWKFAVYDIGNSKVKKVPLSLEEMRKVLLARDKEYGEGELEKLIAELIHVRDQSIDGIKARNINRKLLANPVFLEDGSYLQDKAIPLSLKLKETKGDNEKGKKVLDDYIGFIPECWKSGFSDPVFNFTKNNGYISGKVVLFDIDELNFSKDYAVKDIKEKRWLKSYSYKRDINEELQEYYRFQMDKNITLERLNKCWKDAPLLV